MDPATPDLTDFSHDPECRMEFNTKAQELAHRNRGWALP